jgi:ornithine cyclodeaminase
VRELRRVRVWSRSAARAAEFAARESTAGLAVEPVSSPRAAVEGADIVCTVTAATTPVLEGAWLQPGAHVNAVGACVPTARELDTDAVRRAVLVTDRRDSLLAEAGDFLLPLAAGEIDASHLRGELGEVLTGRVRGRSCAAEITLFKSLGIGIEDVAAGWHAYRKAIDRGRGRELAIGDCPPSVEMGPRA